MSVVCDSVALTYYWMHKDIAECVMDSDIQYVDAHSRPHILTHNATKTVKTFSPFSPATSHLEDRGDGIPPACQGSAQGCPPSGLRITLMRGARGPSLTDSPTTFALNADEKQPYFSRSSGTSQAPCPITKSKSWLSCGGNSFCSLV